MDHKKLSTRYGLNRWFVKPIGPIVILAALTVSSPASSPASLPARAGETFRILAYGDSLTAGYGLSRADSFPVRLQEALNDEGFRVEITNAGVSGDTTTGGLARLDWALAATGGAPPQMVILELGANDGLRGVDPPLTFANLDKLIGRFKELEIRVLLTGMRAPPNLGRGYTVQFNAIFPRLAEKHGVAFYPFFLEGVATRPELNQADGLHPNAEGVGVIVRGILPKVAAMVRALTGERQ